MPIILEWTYKDGTKEYEKFLHRYGVRMKKR
jgi:hypothetical protein